MNIRITYKAMEHTDTLDVHIRKQLEKIVHFLENERSPVSIDITVEGHPNHAHNEVTLHITSPHYSVVAHREGQKVVALVDEIIDIGYEMLHKEKRKMVDGRNHRLKE